MPLYIPAGYEPCTHEDAPCCGCQAEQRADDYYAEPFYPEDDDAGPWW